MHYAVLLAEALEYLAIRPEGVYLDTTAGFGGHTREIARQLTTGFVIANDRDAESLEFARANTREFADRIRFHHGTFSNLEQAVHQQGIATVNGLLADLGASRYQLTEPHRGFSILTDGPLDMRMDQSQRKTAGDLVNSAAEEAIADWIYQFGEERRARKIARAIVRARPIRSTLHLAGVVERVAPRTGRLHPATRTFMALRMVVNDEPGELDSLLRLAPGLISPGGRMVVISFMSLEDRKVKGKFRNWAIEGRAEVLTRRPVTPSEKEVHDNPASRSAKLRAAEMK